MAQGLLPLRCMSLPLLVIVGEPIAESSLPCPSFQDCDDPFHNNVYFPLEGLPFCQDCFLNLTKM